MIRVLSIGDPHTKPNNLEDSEKLMHFINDKILEYNPDRVEILGDLAHTHNIIRIEVQDFWHDWLDVFSEASDVYVLEGNHDQKGDRDATMGFIRGFKDLATLKMHNKTKLHIVDSPQTHGIFAYLPYIHDKVKFIEMANYQLQFGAKVLICHQTFEGSKFENGMFAPDGIDLSLIKFETIRSGHIHTHQKFGTLTYPGTPKWDTMSDANKEKGIWYYEHDDITGKILKEEFISTAGVISRWISLEWKEGQPLPAIPANCKVTIELIGSSVWINKKKKELNGTVSIKSKITDKANHEVRKTGNNLETFVKDHFEPIEGVSKTDLIDYMKENKIA